ncbi:DNA-binding transcriptional regulator YhcF, GntR family [Geodermatophilus africanus]|uniref:DNA-binding transcriptional regulator YhcF, GntR family n=1 Tax=Geodermatophilus africanus TaxID=1137993 RepID=A0A1H3M4I3_9ACTN|nr:GntR family transcriptional regulator [Geodermatophilus africanus]SDY71138.1 DNA-binding transcriptional regulator YhcF, GntR family [Geodermatophilus africanus]
MLIGIDPASPVPLGDQVAAAVRRNIAAGAVGPGDRLPAARDLAASLDVNVHTVLRGYQQLRDEGLIELRRGRGAVVSATATADELELTEAAGRLVAAARRLGLAEADVLDAVRRALRRSATAPRG